MSMAGSHELSPQKSLTAMTPVSAPDDFCQGRRSGLSRSRSPLTLGPYCAVSSTYEVASSQTSRLSAGCWRIWLSSRLRHYIRVSLRAQVDSEAPQGHPHACSISNSLYSSHSWSAQISSG